MIDVSGGHVVALVAHARHVPAIERERFAGRLRDELRDRALIVETCHRVEAYAMGADAGEAIASEVTLPPGGQALTGDAAVRHAISVAVGRDSVVIGEDQILHQLRATVDASRTAHTLDPMLERLFALALRAGRRARSWRQGPQRSLADVAIASIEGLGGPIRGRDILVVGAGRMGRLVARAAAAAGATVAVANRSTEGAEALASATGARIEAFDPGERVGRFAGIVIALGGPWPVGAAAIETAAASPTIVVDLSVPAAVPAVLARLLDARLVTADALAHVESEPESDDGSAERLDTLIDRTTEEFVAWQKGRVGRAAAEALVERADREREAELAALWRQLPDLEPDAREAIEGMSRHLADRLLREPLERLGRDIDGRDERAVRDLFAL